MRPGDAATLDSRGFTYLKTHEWDKAIADYDTALRAHPAQASSLFGRGIAKLRKGDAAGGNADLSAARRIQADIATEMAAIGIAP